MSNLTEQTTTNNREFKVGDAIVRRWNNRVYWIITDVDNGSEFMISENKNAKFKDCKVCDMPCNFTHATPEEIKLGRRIDNRVTVITPKGTQKVKGGMVAFVEMGDDAHIENHISPLCVSKSSKSDSQIIAELKAENKMLHEAAATHLRNQNQFMDLYNRLVEQLYPYALDLNEPVVGNVKTTPQEFIDGYNRALECAHYNLLEMMESDVEYIRAQCGMLGGGGEV
ncbi:MAG TPA: hypothetical protein PLQ39_09995 [Acinetobacter sp.]|nr:hypothetical protein [Acinetobacter sp.]